MVLIWNSIYCVLRLGSRPTSGTVAPERDKMTSPKNKPPDAGPAPPLPRVPANTPSARARADEGSRLRGDHRAPHILDAAKAAKGLLPPLLLPGLPGFDREAHRQRDM